MNIGVELSLDDSITFALPFLSYIVSCIEFLQFYFVVSELLFIFVNERSGVRDLLHVGSKECRLRYLSNHFFFCIFLMVYIISSILFCGFNFIAYSRNARGANHHFCVVAVSFQPDLII